MTSVGELDQLSVAVCTAVSDWLNQQHEHGAGATFCDKASLNASTVAAMEAAASKKERKSINRQAEARRQDLESRMRAVATEALPEWSASLLALHAGLQPLLQQLEAACRADRDCVRGLGSVEERRKRCRVFYDGTGDSTYSNFKSFPFAVGKLGFLKGEQMFHVAKAVVCQDLDKAVEMMVTTGGPKLRQLGRECKGYAQNAGRWEDVDSGLLLLVMIVIKLAACKRSATLIRELRSDGQDKIHIVESAKDDDRCGIGFHADDKTLWLSVDSWGRNQLGHACMAVARYGADMARRGVESGVNQEEPAGPQAAAPAPTPATEQMVRFHLKVQTHVDQGTVVNLAAKTTKQRLSGRGARPESDAAQKRGIVVGIDFGGVICGGGPASDSSQEDTSMFGERYLNTPAVADAFECIAALVAALGPANCFIVSKAGEKIRRKSSEWLLHHSFYQRTGFLSTNVYFCKDRPDKVPICEILGVTHFIDDKLDVLRVFDPQGSSSPRGSNMAGKKGHDRGGPKYGAQVARYLFPSFKSAKDTDRARCRCEKLPDGLPRGIVAVDGWRHLSQLILSSTT